VRPGRSGARRAAAGLVLGAAGVIASRLTGRRAGEQQPPPEPQREPGERAPSGDEIERARAELSEELRRRAEGADNPRP
jgi:hypothetical protein